MHEMKTSLQQQQQQQRNYKWPPLLKNNIKHKNKPKPKNKILRSRTMSSRSRT